MDPSQSNRRLGDLGRAGCFMRLCEVEIWRMTSAAKRAAADRAWKELRPLMNHQPPRIPPRPGSPRVREEFEAKQARRDALEKHASILLAALAFYVKANTQTDASAPPVLTVRAKT